MRSLEEELPFALSEEVLLVRKTCVGLGLREANINNIQNEKWIFTHPGMTNIKEKR